MAEKMNAGDRPTDRDTLHYFVSGLVGMCTLWWEWDMLIGAQQYFDTYYVYYSKGMCEAP